MTPAQAKSEEVVADLIESWLREEEELQRLDSTLTSTDPWNMSAVNCILAPKLYDHAELRSGPLTNYEELRKGIMMIAVQKRLNNNLTTRTDPNRMGAGSVGRETAQG